MMLNTLKQSLQRTALAIGFSTLTLPIAGFAAIPTESQSLLDIATQQGSVEILVGLDMPFTPEGQLTSSETLAQWQAIHDKQTTFNADLARTLKNTGLLDVPHPTQMPPDLITHRFKTIPYVVMDVNTAVLSVIQESIHVDSIKLREISQTALSEVASLTGANQFYSAGFSGAGQTVAVLDTGSSQTSEFDACFSLHGDCPNGEMVQYGAGAAVPCTFANCEHGSVTTHALKALLPEANIISIQIASNLEGIAGFKETDQVSALEYIYQLHTSGQQTITAINMSLGNSYSEPGGATQQGFSGSCNDSSGENADARLAIIQNLASAGIAVVAASGNDGFTDGMHKPACYDEVVSVGAVDKDGDLWAGSNRSETLDLLAPGVDVAVPLENGEMIVQTGTSLAAPAVTAGIALLKQAHPTSDVEGIVHFLKHTGDKHTGIATMQLDNAFNALHLDEQATDSATLVVATRGLGDVQSSDAAIHCGDRCEANYASTVMVTLTAQPQADQQFTHWSGDCTGTTASLDVMMDTTKICIAHFESLAPAKYTIFVEKRNKGNVTIYKKDKKHVPCWVNEVTCLFEVDPGETVELRVATLKEYEFVGWGEACSHYGNMRRITLTVNSNLSCKAEFIPIPNYPGKPIFTMQIIGEGSLEAAGFTCLNGTCQYTYKEGKQIWIRMMPKTGHQFVQWVGEDCPLAGTTGGRMLMSQDYTCTAIFAPERLLSDPAELADFIEDIQFNDTRVKATGTYPVNVLDEALHLLKGVTGLVERQIDINNPVPWVTHLVEAPMYLAPAGQYVESVTVKQDYYVLISFINDAYPQIAVIYGGLDNGSWGNWAYGFTDLSWRRTDAQTWW